MKYNGEDNLDRAELDIIFDFTWRSMYRTGGVRKGENTENNYRNIQAELIRKATNKLGGDNNANLIAQLKLVDILYKEIIVADLPRIAEAKGIHQREAKEMLYQKIFGREQQENTLSSNQENKQSKKEVEEKNISYEGNHIPQMIEYKDEGKTVVVTLLGKMQYYNTSGVTKEIYKYSIMLFTKREGQPVVDINTVFGKFDFSRAEKDEEYREIVFQKLLNSRNINKTGDNGYIGEFVEREESEPKEYEIKYDGEDYVAVIEYKEKEEKMLEKIMEQFGGEKE